MLNSSREVNVHQFFHGIPASGTSRDVYLGLLSQAGGEPVEPGGYYKEPRVRSPGTLRIILRTVSDKLN